MGHVFIPWKTCLCRMCKEVLPWYQQVLSQDIFIQMCDMTHFICVTWLIHMCIYSSRVLPRSLTSTSERLTSLLTSTHTHQESYQGVLPWNVFDTDEGVFPQMKEFSHRWSSLPTDQRRLPTDLVVFRQIKESSYTSKESSHRWRSLPTDEEVLAQMKGSSHTLRRGTLTHIRHIRQWHVL